MRFTVAWANVISENLTLKFILACLVVALIGLSAVVIRLSGKKPLIVERACFSRALAITDEGRTSAEVESFVREALSIRFDTAGQLKPGYLSLEEEKFRSQEQQEFKKREMSQKIIVHSVAVDGQTATVDADRLISIGSVRSVLAFPLTLSLGAVPRSDGNPYGLSLIRVSAPKPDNKANGGGK